MTVEAGKTYRALVGIYTYKVHIDRIFNSIYKGKRLIIYRYYGKHKQWWHEELCDEYEMKTMIEKAKNYDNGNR